jgi:hypothetical protein
MTSAISTSKSIGRRFAPALAAVPRTARMGAAPFDFKGAGFDVVSEISRERAA